MRKLLCVILLSLFILWPANAFASGFSLNIHLQRQEDGTALGELWCNDKIVWRLELLCDGARPATSRPGVSTTTLIPEMLGGLFVIKVN